MHRHLIIITARSRATGETFPLEVTFRYIHEEQNALNEALRHHDADFVAYVSY